MKQACIVFVRNLGKVEWEGKNPFTLKGVGVMSPVLHLLTPMKILHLYVKISGTFAAEFFVIFWEVTVGGQRVEWTSLVLFCNLLHPVIDVIVLY